MALVLLLLAPPPSFLCQLLRREGSSVSLCPLLPGHANWSGVCLCREAEAALLLGVY